MLYIVEFERTEWQYVKTFADTRDDAIRIAKNKLKDIDWTDFGNDYKVRNVEEIREDR